MADYLRGLSQAETALLERVNAPGLAALKKHLDSGKAVAFLGAGASAPLYPVWEHVIHELVDTAALRGLDRAKAETYRSIAKQNPDSVVELVKRQLGEAHYRETLRTMFEPRHDPASDNTFTPVHEHVCRCAFAGVVTTNYDTGIVQARWARRGTSPLGGVTTLSDETALDAWKNGDVFTQSELPVLYAHGHYNSPEHIVLATSDYRRTYAGKLSLVLARLVESQRLVWIGFSFADQRIKAILDKVAQHTGTLANPGGPARHVAVMGWDPTGGYDPHTLRDLAEIDYCADLVLYPAPHGDRTALVRLLSGLAEHRSPRVGPAAGVPLDGRDALEPLAPDVLAALRTSYLAWIVKVTERVPVRGLRESRGALDLPLEQVYVELKVDPSSPTERTAASQNLLRELEAELSDRDHELTAEQEQDYRWFLYADLPPADYLGTADWLERLRVEDPQVLSVAQLYRRDRAAVVLGDPGSGKTTIMRWLALLHAKALQSGAANVAVGTGGSDEPSVLGPALFPILVRIAEFGTHCHTLRANGEPPCSLLEFLGQHTWDLSRPVWSDDIGDFRKGDAIPASILARVLRAALDDNRALVVLDGLDEVAAEERKWVAEAVTEFIDHWAPARHSPRVTNKVFVTSRIAGYQLAPLPADLTQVTVERMTDGALTVFVHNWMTAVFDELAQQGGNTERDTGRIAELAGDLLGLLRQPRSRYVRELATNPLLASTILSIFLNGQGQLPSQRVEVYQEAVDSLVTAWSDRLSRSFTPIDRETLFAALPAVAAHIHGTKPTGVIAEREFREVLLREMARIEHVDPGVPHPKLEVDVDSLLEIMRVELGLLVQSGPDAFRFSHQTFQEFLAAHHLVSDEDQSARRIIDHLGDPRWREPVLMAIGIVNWRHPGRIVGLVENLLAVDGPLAELFPESALILAAAVSEMSRVPPEVVHAVMTRLLRSYSILSRSERLPRLRELIEAAATTLRTGDRAAEVDGVLATALTRPEGDDPAFACAAARLARSLDIRSAPLAVALTEAARRWDHAELGYPIAETLSLLAAPAPRGDSPPRLPADWGSGILRMQATLRQEPELVERICSDPRWLSLVLCLYGGYPNLGAADSLDEYQRISAFLQLPADMREPFTSYFSQRWGRDDPIYTMAVHLDTTKLKVPAGAAPTFTPDAIVRDSPFTMSIVHALREDDLGSLVAFLRTRLDVRQGATRAEALLALWALGHDVDTALHDGSEAALLASRRIGALQVELRDATVRAGRHASPALSAAAPDLPPEDWRRLYAALATVLIEAGSEPISLRDALAQLPEPHRVSAIAEEITHRFHGWDDDNVYIAAVLVDTVDAAQHSPAVVIDALNGRGTAAHGSYARYSYWWPADPLALPYDGRADIPISVLDQVVRMPQELGFGMVWALRAVCMPFIEENPQLRPEVLAVAWTGVGHDHNDVHELIERLDPELLQTASPAARLLDLTAGCDDPWHQARALLRIAELFPDSPGDPVARAVEQARSVTDPVQAFELHERLLVMDTPDRAVGHRTVCRRFALSIADAGVAARALLRLARSTPSGELDELTPALLDRIAAAEPLSEHVELVRQARRILPDHSGTAAMLARMPTGGIDRAYVDGRWGAIVDHHLDRLVAQRGPTVQAWVPVALYGRARDVQLAGDHDATTEAWSRLGDDPTPQTIAAVLARHPGPTIHCTTHAALALTRALARAPAQVLDPVLERLVRLDCGAEPAVAGWLAHREPRAQQAAALLIGEHRGLDGRLVRPITSLLLDEDDLLRTRARNILGQGTSRHVETAVTRIGRSGVEELYAFATEQQDDEPGAALAITWFSNGLLHDDAPALLSWCAAIDAASSPDRSEREAAAVQAITVRAISAATGPAWSALLERLLEGGAPLQSRILEAVAAMCWKAAVPAGSDVEHHWLRLTPERWDELWAVLQRLDPGPLDARHIAVPGPRHVIDAAAKALSATGGNLDPTTVHRASSTLRSAVGTSFGEILATGEQGEVRTRLEVLGKVRFAGPGRRADEVEAFHHVSTDPAMADCPWVHLLTAWTTELLTRAPYDPLGSNECGMLLGATAGAAELNPDTFRQAADTARLSQLLADATTHHNGYDGREAAVRMIGVLRHGSRPVLDALRRSLHDVYQVRNAALQAIPRLRNVDQDMVDDLKTALYDRSATVAWAAAQLLATIGESAATPARRRADIISSLAAATRDERSRRTVHFSFVDASIPNMPDLDDTFAEALRRVYRLG
jgi:hypothetical protein